MDKIIDFLKSEMGTLVLFFAFLIIVFVVYFIIEARKKPSERMRSEKRELTLPKSEAQKDEVSNSDTSELEETSSKKEQEYIENIDEGNETDITIEVAEKREEKTDENPYAAIRYSYSYFAHLTVAPLESQKRYNEIKQFIMSYEGINDSITFKEERFIYLGKTIIKFRLISNVLRIYLALSADEIKVVNIKSKDLSAMKEHERTPSLLRISGNTGVKRAKEAIILLMEKLEITKSEEENTTNYIPEKRSVEELINLDYIRVK